MNSQQELINIIQDITKKNGGAYDTPATVLRVDGDTVWVHIDGGADETPVNKTIACEAGETVQVRIANGSAFLVGNASSPPTDDKRANAAHFIAEQATETATQAVESVEALSQTVKEDYVAAGDSNVHTLSSTMYQNANGVNIFNDELAAGDSYAHIDGDSFDIRVSKSGIIDDTNDSIKASFGTDIKLYGDVGYFLVNDFGIRAGSVNETDMQIGIGGSRTTYENADDNARVRYTTPYEDGIFYDISELSNVSIGLLPTVSAYHPQILGTTIHYGAYFEGDPYVVLEYRYITAFSSETKRSTELSGSEYLSYEDWYSENQTDRIFNLDAIAIMQAADLTGGSHNTYWFSDPVIYVYQRIRNIVSSDAGGAVSLGRNASALEGRVIAIGEGALAGRQYGEFVIGTYNAPYRIGHSNPAIIVGNGTSDNARSNIIEIADGVIYVNGDIRDLITRKLKYVPEPAIEGTAGQVLTTDGNGGRIWTTVSSSGVPEEYTFHILNTAASTAVAWCNKTFEMSFTNQQGQLTRATAGEDLYIWVYIKIGENLSDLYVPSHYDSWITSVSLFDKATSKQVIASANFYQTADVANNNGEYFLRIMIHVNGSFITSAIATAINAVIDSVSPGISFVYAANTLNIEGVIKGQGIVEQIPGFASTFNTLPTSDRITQHIGDFYLPTGGPRWNLEIEVDPGTAYYAVCYLENTTTGAYFNHSIAYCGVGVPTIAAPTVAPAPVAGKTITFVGTTWSPFVAGVAGVVTDGVVTKKPRLRIQGYHASNTPTAGLGMHMRLFRIY